MTKTKCTTQAFLCTNFNLIATIFGAQMPILSFVRSDLKEVLFIWK